MNTIDDLLKNCVTTSQAAKVLGVTEARVRQILQAGGIVGARKWGKEWVIPRVGLGYFAKIPRKIGRPKANAD